VREPDGLAMSSRNGRLSAAEREDATSLVRSLREGSRLLKSGERAASAIEKAMIAVMDSSALVCADYAAVVEPETLEPLEDVPRGTTVRLLVAARVGPIRLIDNLEARAL
ncbi:MAG: pantoate--beta-alanine ligase, partial [Acidimicrobiales bacterium]